MAEEALKLIIEAYKAVFEGHKENMVEENGPTENNRARDSIFEVQFRKRGMKN